MKVLFFILSILILSGCNPQFKNALEEFNYVQCQDWCIKNENSFYKQECLNNCYLRQELKFNRNAYKK